VFTSQITVAKWKDALIVVMWRTLWLFSEFLMRYHSVTERHGIKGPYRPDAIWQRDANFQFSMTFNFNIFQCFSNIRDHLSNFSYLVCISCKIFICFWKLKIRVALPNRVRSVWALTPPTPFRKYVTLATEPRFRRRCFQGKVNSLTLEWHFVKTFFFKICLETNLELI
jgi:hypothetical protein